MDAGWISGLSLEISQEEDRAKIILQNYFRCSVTMLENKYFTTFVALVLRAAF